MIAVEISIAVGERVVARIQREVELAEKMEGGKLIPGTEWVERTLEPMPETAEADHQNEQFRRGQMK